MFFFPKEAILAFCSTRMLGGAHHQVWLLIRKAVGQPKKERSTRGRREFSTHSSTRSDKLKQSRSGAPPNCWILSSNYNSVKSGRRIFFAPTQSFVSFVFPVCTSCPSPRESFVLSYLDYNFLITPFLTRHHSYS